MSTVSSCTLLCSALHSRAEQSSVLTVKHSSHSKQHTLNPLIAPHVSPFLPSAISTVSVLFISTDHCIGVTGDVSDTKSVPPQGQNACHSPAISR
ncbi:unnamed protein product [Staurois parvus]|uniref:Secreted protein n=1 Tax=Staurois parvus TaxID=386267 RepID=A0ABN9H8Z5_9NEOB|nr:unnamed protein product [Staurois parvus]